MLRRRDLHEVGGCRQVQATGAVHSERRTGKPSEIDGSRFSPRRQHGGTARASSKADFLVAVLSHPVGQDRGAAEEPEARHRNAAPEVDNPLEGLDPTGRSPKPRSRSVEPKIQSYLAQRVGTRSDGRKHSLLHQSRRREHAVGSPRFLRVDVVPPGAQRRQVLGLPPGPQTEKDPAEVVPGLVGHRGGRFRIRRPRPDFDTARHGHTGRRRLASAYLDECQLPVVLFRCPR